MTNKRHSFCFQRCTDGAGNVFYYGVYCVAGETGEHIVKTMLGVRMRFPDPNTASQVAALYLIQHLNRKLNKEGEFAPDPEPEPEQSPPDRLDEEAEDGWYL